MKKATTIVRKTRAKSPASSKAKTEVKSRIKVKSINAVAPTAIPKTTQALKANHSFLSGLVVVISGILALIIFLSLFFRFMIGIALYNELENQNLLVQENERMEVESNEIEASLNDLMKLADTPALSSEMDVDSSEFMELPTDSAALADLNFVNSPDGSKFAYVVRNEEGKYAVMLNDAISSYYDEILFMTFSPDSQHFAYGAEINNRESVVIDGKQGKAYDWIFMPRFFTPDSKYFVYKARTEFGDRLVFNESEQEMYDQIYNPFISSDKTEMIYYARRGNKIYKNSLALEKYED